MESEIWHDFKDWFKQQQQQEQQQDKEDDR